MATPGHHSLRLNDSHDTLPPMQAAAAAQNGPSVRILQDNTNLGLRRKKKYFPKLNLPSLNKNDSI
jgi:hypothetical protein